MIRLLKPTELLEPPREAGCRAAPGRIERGYFETTSSATVERTDRVAVAIVNWNSGDALLHCLAALARQSLAPHRVVVVDNGSTDGSCEGLERQYPAVELIRLGVNIGFAAANNLVSRLVDDCHWIAMLNCDAAPHVDWLAELVRAVQLHPDCAVFSSKLLRASAPDLLDGAGDCYHASGAAWRRWYGRPAGEQPERIEEVFSPCAAAAMYRHDVLLEVGGLDAGYFCYFEDVDLGFRLRLAGHRALHVPRSVVRHVGSGTTAVGSDFAVYHGHRNLVWTYVKNMPGMLFWQYLPQHLLFNLATLLCFSLRGQARTIFRAKWHALVGLPGAWRQRRHVQSARKITPRQLRRALLKGWLRPYFGRRN